MLPTSGRVVYIGQVVSVCGTAMVELVVAKRCRRLCLTATITAKVFYGVESGQSSKDA